MFSQPYRNSSEEESSEADSGSKSTVSDATSRATGTADSWYDVKSDVEQQEELLARQTHQTKKSIVQEKIDYNQQVDDDDEEEDDDDDDEEDDDDDDDDSDQAIINSVNDIYINGSTKKPVEDDSITETSNSAGTSPKEQKECTNPYWDNKPKSVETITNIQS